jgi:signal transduction histidine kinase
MTSAISTLEITMTGHVKRYGAAVLAVGVMCIVVVALDDVLPFHSRILFVAPVVVASRLGGRGPALLAAALGVIAIGISFLPTMSQEGLSPQHALTYAAFFAMVALSIDSTNEALREARRVAEHRSEQLAFINRQLEEHVEEVQTLTEHLYETNQSLEAARDEAQAASRAREEVLAVVAHDLRNPLNLVTTATQLFIELEPGEMRRNDLLGVIDRAAHRMNRLIEDLLEVVRIDGGRLALDMRTVRADEILALTGEQFQFAAAEKGVSLVIDTVSPDLRVDADLERVAQVMGNLVSNALKFVERGGCVRVGCIEDETSARFVVTDTGPGMAPAQLERLFEKFWQARRTDRRGVGLGLTIARGIVEAHGGRIWADSRIGEGSTFHFTLPLDDASARVSPAVSALAATLQRAPSPGSRAGSERTVR